MRGLLRVADVELDVVGAVDRKGVVRFRTDGHTPRRHRVSTGERLARLTERAARRHTARRLLEMLGTPTCAVKGKSRRRHGDTV